MTQFDSENNFPFFRSNRNVAFQINCSYPFDPMESGWKDVQYRNRCSQPSVKWSFRDRHDRKSRREGEQIKMYGKTDPFEEGNISASNGWRLFSFNFLSFPVCHSIVFHIRLTDFRFIWVSSSIPYIQFTFWHFEFCTKNINGWKQTIVYDPYGFCCWCMESYS